MNYFNMVIISLKYRKNIYYKYHISRIKFILPKTEYCTLFTCDAMYHALKYMFLSHTHSLYIYLNTRVNKIKFGRLITKYDLNLEIYILNTH